MVGELSAVGKNVFEIGKNWGVTLTEKYQEQGRQTELW
jgi:hypothetical protein